MTSHLVFARATLERHLNGISENLSRRRYSVPILYLILFSLLSSIHVFPPEDFAEEEIRIGGNSVCSLSPQLTDMQRRLYRRYSVSGSFSTGTDAEPQLNEAVSYSRGCLTPTSLPVLEYLPEGYQLQFSIVATGITQPFPLYSRG